MMNKVMYEGKEIELTQDAFANNDGEYEAAGIMDGKNVSVLWKITDGDHSEDNDESEMCDWNHPAYVLDENGRVI